MGIRSSGISVNALAVTGVDVLGAAAIAGGGLPMPRTVTVQLTLRIP